MMIASELTLFANNHLLAVIDSFCPVSAYGFEAQNVQSLTDPLDEISQRFRPWLAGLIGGFLTGALLLSLPVRELLAKRRQLWAERPCTSQQAAQLRQLLRRVGRQYRFVVFLQVVIFATAMLAKAFQCNCLVGINVQWGEVPLVVLLALETIAVLLINLQLRSPVLRGKMMRLLRHARWLRGRIAHAKPTARVAQVGG